MKASGGSKTIYLNVGVWYNEKQGRIHLNVKGAAQPMTTISADPQRERGHPHLFKKLAMCLKEAGMPHPDIEEQE